MLWPNRNPNDNKNIIRTLFMIMLYNNESNSGPNIRVGVRFVPSPCTTPCTVFSLALSL